MEEASSLEVSIDIEKENGEVPLKTMVISLREELEKLSPLTPNHCIYRVPKQLHIKNPAAYTPKVVSIGPIHHKREGLEAMEEHKQRYMQFFLERVKISLEDYAEFVMIREGRLRECYSDTINYKSNEFVKIMMIDSAFVYEMLVRINYGVDESCRIFNRPYLVTNVMEDLLLLENQIPLFILNDLFELDMEATSCQQPISSLRSNGLEHPEEAINGEEHVKLGMVSLNSEDASKDREEMTTDISSTLVGQDKVQCCANLLRPLTNRARRHFDKPEEDISVTPPLKAVSNSFMELVCKFVNRRPDIGTNEFDFNKVCSSKVVHLLDCLWRCHLSPRELMYPLESKSNCSTFMPCSPTCPGGELDFLASVPETRNFFLRLPKKVVGYLILGCLWRSWRRPCFLLVPSREANEVFHLGVSVPTATELHQSGVRFTQNIESTHLLDIKFDRQLGILKIPHFFMGDATEAIFRNLLAFEQCHYDEGPKFTDYFLFLGQLINEPRDVELLVKSGVIENTLGDSMRAASIINNITQGLSLTHFSYFDSLCKELTKYYKVPWHKWKATLRQVYFDNPWAGISVIAAIILLLLTVVQAVFAVISK